MHYVPHTCQLSRNSGKVYLSIYIHKNLLHALFYNEYMHLQIMALCTWIPNACLTWSAMVAEVLSHGVVVSHTLWAPSRLEVTSSEAWGAREGGEAEERDLLCCFFASLIQRIKSDQLPKGGVLVALWGTSSFACFARFSNCPLIRHERSNAGTTATLCERSDEKSTWI